MREFRLRFADLRISVILVFRLAGILNCRAIFEICRLLCRRIKSGFLFIVRTDNDDGIAQTAFTTCSGALCVHDLYEFSGLVTSIAGPNGGA